MIALLWSLTLVVLAMAASERGADSTCTEPEIDLKSDARKRAHRAATIAPAARHVGCCHVLRHGSGGMVAGHHTASQEAGGSTCDHTLYRLMRPRSRDGQFEAFKVCACAVWASTSVAQLRAVFYMYELSTYKSRSDSFEADMP